MTEKSIKLHILMDKPFSVDKSRAGGSLFGKFVQFLYFIDVIIYILTLTSIELILKICINGQVPITVITDIH